MSGDVASVSASSYLAANFAPPAPPPPPASQSVDPATAAAASKRPLLNPSLHVDLALNIVVLEFIDKKGTVTDSIPSEKQLKAYRDNASGAGAVVGLALKKID